MKCKCKFFALRSLFVYDDSRKDFLSFRKTRQAVKRPCARVRCATNDGVGVENGKARAVGDAPVQQIIGNNNSNNNVSTYSCNATCGLSDYERELLKVCASFDIRRKTALLTYAYNLEKEMKENKES